MDTLTTAWSIASGNYSNRFAAIAVDAIAQAAARAAERLKHLAAELLEVEPAQVELAEGNARLIGQPEHAVPLRRAAARAHWDPVGLPGGMTPGIYETVVVSPPTLKAPDAEDRIASAVTYGFVIDVVGVEIEPETGELRIDRYASVHDVGKRINPLIVEGQTQGGFVHGLGAALMEELAYDSQGNFLSGTFADYLCPTAPEVPPITVGYIETPSPMNALGAKGMGDGSSMLTPSAIANAVADALGRDDIRLPLTRQRVWALANGKTLRASGARADTDTDTPDTRHGLNGAGEATLPAAPADVWKRLTDPAELAALVPGCRELAQIGPDRYRARVAIGVAAIRGLYDTEIELRDQDPPRFLRLVGKASGALGHGTVEGDVHLTATPEGGTRLSYRYRARVGGKVAAVGSRMLDTVMQVLIAGFFRALERRLAPRAPNPLGAWAARLWRRMSRKAP